MTTPSPLKSNRMKLIHCADIHLDSAMTSHIAPDTARKRRGEILRNFERMVEFAAAEDVGAILIAGDLFDTPVTSELTRSTLLHCITSHPGIAFFYLRGNHDEKLLTEGLFEKPFNLMLFGEEWSCYECGGVAIYGRELFRERAGFYNGLQPEPDKINIVMLHGQISEHPSGVAYGIDLKQLRQKNIDYLALGHLHAHSEGRLDDRGIYCYSGCLEGRGFDECDGEHGFMLLETDSDTRSISSRFIPFEKRRLHSVTADVSGCMTTNEMIAAASKAITGAGCQESSLIRLVLRGELDPACEKDVGYMASTFAEKYYYCKVADETRMRIRLEDYLLDQSLRGEFVRNVSGDSSLSDDDKAMIVRYGLKALAGEEADAE